MSRNTIPVLSVAFALTSSVALAQNSALAGAGVLACSDYVKAAATGDAAAGAFVAWAQGLMTALNLTRDQGHKHTRVLVDKDHPVEKQAAFLLDYCKRSPSAQFVSAALTLYRSLPFER